MVNRSCPFTLMRNYYCMLRRRTRIPVNVGAAKVYYYYNADIFGNPILYGTF